MKKIKSIRTFKDMSKKIDTTYEVPAFYRNKPSFANYIRYTAQEWARKEKVSLNNLIASFLYGVLSGQIKVEFKPQTELTNITRLSLQEKVLSNAPCSAYFYNLYNQYDIPLVNYDDNYFMLSYKRAIHAILEAGDYKPTDRLRGNYYGLELHKQKLAREAANPEEEIEDSTDDA